MFSNRMDGRWLPSTKSTQCYCHTEHEQPSYATQPLNTRTESLLTDAVHTAVQETVEIYKDIN
jgi:hypothetical protein